MNLEYDFHGSYAYYCNAVGKSTLKSSRVSFNLFFGTFKEGKEIFNQGSTKYSIQTSENIPHSDYCGVSHTIRFSVMRNNHLLPSISRHVFYHCSPEHVLMQSFHFFLSSLY